MNKNYLYKFSFGLPSESTLQMTQNCCHKLIFLQLIFLVMYGHHILEFFFVLNKFD
jgi:hypothetical protein